MNSYCETCANFFVGIMVARFFRGPLPANAGSAPSFNSFGVWSFSGLVRAELGPYEARPTGWLGNGPTPWVKAGMNLCLSAKRFGS